MIRRVATPRRRASVDLEVRLLAVVAVASLAVALVLALQLLAVC